MIQAAQDRHGEISFKKKAGSDAALISVSITDKTNVRGLLNTPVDLEIT